MYSLHGFLHGIKWIMFHGHLDCFQQPRLRGRPETKPGDHGTMGISMPSIYYIFIMCEEPPPLMSWIYIAFGWGPRQIWLHTTLEGPWSHYMILEVFWDNLWTLLLGSHNILFTALGSCVKSPLSFVHRYVQLGCLGGKVSSFANYLGWK
jgi:hypothetical protein